MKHLDSLLRFSGISAFCLLLHNLILIGANANGLSYGTATLISYVIVVVAGYCLHSSYTFGVERNGISFARYALAMAGNVPALWLLLGLLIGHLGWPMLLAAPVSTLIMTSFNFIMSHWALLGSHRYATVKKERA